MSTHFASFILCSLIFSVTSLPFNAETDQLPATFASGNLHSEAPKDADQSFFEKSSGIPRSMSPTSTISANSTTRGPSIQNNSQNHYSTSSSTQNKNSNNVILVYPIEGCRGSTSESAKLYSGNDIELQSSRRARDIALSELEKRVNGFITERTAKSGFSSVFRFVNGGRRLEQQRQTNTTSTINVNSYNEEETSLRLKSRYLSALQMEITSIPASVTEDEMLELSAGLPCVEMVSRDYVKTIQDPEKSEPIPTPIKTTNVHESRSYLSWLTQLFSSLSSVSSNESRVLEGSKGSSLKRPVHLRGSEAQYLTFVTPNDELFGDQWHLQHNVFWSIGPHKTWKDWKGSPSMVIAVIDSGCDLNHPDLKAKRWRNTGEICGDGIDNDKNGYIDDCYGWDWVDNDNSPHPEDSGHGTAAAGIIAADTNNEFGVAGICWECRIMCLRFIKGIEGSVSNQVSAIDYAAKMGAKISNNSYGGYGFSKLEYEVIRRARAYGHLFVASAGNNNHDTDLPQFDHTPSIYNLDNILAVGASTIGGRKAPFSNYGRNTVDLFAPGSKIVTTEHGGGYASVSGTSFAAPMGAGAAALVWSRFPFLSYQEVIKLLIESCKHSKDLLGLAQCAGVIDIDAAMDKASAIAAAKAQGDVSVIPFNSQDPITGHHLHNDVMHKPPSTDFSSLTPTGNLGYMGWLAAFLVGFNKSWVQGANTIEDDRLVKPNNLTENIVGVEMEDLKIHNNNNVSVSMLHNDEATNREDMTKYVVDPNNSTTENLLDILSSNYLLFQGINHNGSSIVLDPMYLNEQDFNALITPYETAFGLLRQTHELDFKEKQNSKLKIQEDINNIVPEKSLFISSSDVASSPRQLPYMSQQLSSFPFTLTSTVKSLLDNIFPNLFQK